MCNRLRVLFPVIRAHFPFSYTNQIHRSTSCDGTYGNPDIFEIQRVRYC